MPLEKSIEKTFVKSGSARGYVVVKLVCVERYGFPDRTVLGPDRRVGFVELKQAGKKPEKLQEWWLALLNRLGFPTAVIDTSADIEPFYDRMDNLT